MNKTAIAEIEITTDAVRAVLEDQSSINVIGE
jgi:hypothetical protein